MNKKHTVEFDSNGGTFVHSSTVNDGDKLKKPSDPTKDGFDFDGWYTTNDLKTAYDFSTPVHSSFVLYAGWQSNETHVWVISFESNGGSPVDSVAVNNGGLLVEPNAPTKDGFVFDGWYENSNLTRLYDFSTPVRSSFILYAKWKANIPDTWTVNFISDGKVLSTQEVANGGLLEQPDNPEKNGYTFEGWFMSGSTSRFDFSTLITSSFDLYAKWSTQEYMVTFNLNYDNLPEVKYSTEKGYVTFVPERSGFVFNGWWYCDGIIDGKPILNRSFSTSTKVTSDGLELFAEWIEEKEYANQLDAPIVSIDGYSISWGQVNNASNYQIVITAKVNGVYETYVDTKINRISYTFNSSYEANTYTIKVRAIGDGYNYVNSAYTSKTYAHKTLTSPRNFSYNSYKFLLQWDEVLNATGYTLTIDKNETVSITNNYYDFTNYDAGSHSIKVTATRSGWISSSSSYSFTKLYLKTPINLSATFDDIDNSYHIEWDTVTNADSYKIYIDDFEKETILTNTYVLSGDSDYYSGARLEFSIAAFDSNFNYFISPKTENLLLDRMYSVKYELNGGTNSSSNPSTYTGEEDVIFEAPTKIGYTFLGWFDGNGNRVTSISAGSTGALTLTAHWTANLNNLSVTSEDTSKGTVSITSGSGYSDESITVVATPVGDCVFKGWYHESTRISGEATYTFTMPTNDYSLVAHFFTKGEEEEEEERAQKYGTRPIVSDDGKTITYGLYPQKNVNNSSLVSALNALTTPESNGWYLYEGDYYAKVSATPYSSNYVFDNGTTISNGTTYWFKCEPIVWNVLSNNSGEYYIVSSVLLDAHCYCNSTSSRTIDGQTVYANNYKYSDIRTWLNADFYNSAFALGNEYIQTTTVDNSAATTNSTSNSNACANTEDKVFLPSYKDYINSSYGFSTSTGSTDTRYCRTTDWARARGAYYYTQYNGYYWTRSPSSDYSDFARFVSNAGYLNLSGRVSRTDLSVRPGLSIKIA